MASLGGARFNQRTARRGDAVNATMEIEYSDSIVFSGWSGFDEGDEVSGGGSAGLHDDGTVEIDLSFDISDDATLKARRA
jgi:hypothetical protein